MAVPAPVYKSPYSFHEEIAHTISHGAGLVLALAATMMMMAMAGWAQSPIALWGVGIYGASMTLLFLASTLYHGSFGSRFQRFFKLLDHCAIYLKIAGTYTPFALLVLPHETGIPLLGFVWLLAGVGIAFKITAYAMRLSDRYRWLSLGVYVLMGWSGVVLIGDLFARLPFWGFVWLGIGGIIYTLGAAIYALKSIPMGHFIWHVMVVAASLCHMITVAFYVL